MGNKTEEANLKVLVYSGDVTPRGYAEVLKLRWVRNYRKDNDFMRIIHPPAYYFAYNAYVTSVLKRRDALVMLAVLEDDEDVVLGFSVTERNVLHYVHVPKGYRMQGIGGMLVPKGIEWFTHVTKTGLVLWSLKLPHAKFSPFL